MCINARIKASIDHKYQTLKEFSKDSGVQYRTIQYYLSGDRKIPAAFIVLLHDKIGVSVEWLMTGKGEMFPDSDESAVIGEASDFHNKVLTLRTQMSLSRRAFGELIGVSEAKIQKIEIGAQRADHEFLVRLAKGANIDLNWLLLGAAGPDTSQADSDYTAQIPKFNVTVSAGHGAAVDGETVENYYAFSARWIKSRGLSAEQLCVVTASGDSMEPRLHHGDLIMVDRSQTTIADGVAYVIRWGDDVLVKYVQRIGRDKISLLSENPRYAPRDVDLSQPDDMEIIGRVVGSLHEW